jgi:hypothetical protein
VVAIPIYMIIECLEIQKLYNCHTGPVPSDLKEAANIKFSWEIALIEESCFHRIDQTVRVFKSWILLEFQSFQLVIHSKGA